MSNAFLRFGVLFGFIGVSIGYYMGASHDFTASPVHAHINLLGWVSMFLYGLFYRVLPEAAQGLLPKLHLVLAVTGFLIFMPALAVQVLDIESLFRVAPIGLMVGPTLVLLGMLVFGIIVFMATARSSRTSPA